MLSLPNAGTLFGYDVILVGLAFYGSHRFRLVLRHYRGRRADPVALASLLPFPALRVTR